MARTKNYPNGAKPIKGIAYDDVRGCYYVTLSCGSNSEGKPTKMVKTATTLAEAKEIQKQHKRAQQEGRVAPVVRDTLVERARSFIDFKAMTLEKTTIYGYENIYKNYLEPYFKRRRIQDIGVQEIKAYITYLGKKKKLSNNTIRKHTDFLKQVFKEAYREKIIRENPFSFMDEVKTEVKEKSCFTLDEVGALLKSVENTQLEVPVFLAVYLGLRREEVLGLRWKDIDFDKKVLHIINVKTKAGEDVVEKAPKTKKSERSLCIPEPVIEVLLKNKDKKTKKRSADKPEFRTEYVAVMDNGKPFAVNYLSDCFRRHVEKNGFKNVTFHGLRHTYASIAYNEGASLQDISDALGHSTPSTTTRVYTHEFVREKSAATNVVADSIERAKTPANH